MRLPWSKKKPKEKKPTSWRRWFACPACMQRVIESPANPNHYDTCPYFK